MTPEQLEQQRREQTRRQIERDAEAWATGLGGLDERCLPPDFASARESTFAEQAEDKNGLNRVDMSGLASENGLKTFLNDVGAGRIDDRTAEYLARETNDPKLLADVLDRKAAQVAEEFRKAQPDFYAIDRNFQLMLEEVSRLAGMPDMIDERDRDATIVTLYRAGYWTLPYLRQAFANLKESGELAFEPGSFKPLSEREKHIVRTKIALGSVADAIMHYLAFGKGEHPDMMSFTNPYTFLNDETNLPLVRECIAFVFAELHPEFEPTSERVDWLLQWTGNRFPTLKLIEEGWSRLQQLEQQEAARVERHHLVYGEVEDREQEEPANLEDLTDAEIASLYQRTARHIAKRGKAPGIII
jgi:hypothetical protein